MSAHIRGREVSGDGSVQILVDVDATTLLAVHVPRHVDVAGGTQAVADAAATRYRQRKRQLKGDSR